MAFKTVKPYFSGTIATEALRWLVGCILLLIVLTQVWIRYDLNALGEFQPTLYENGFALANLASIVFFASSLFTLFSQRLNDRTTETYEMLRMTAKLSVYITAASVFFDTGSIATKHFAVHLIATVGGYWLMYVSENRLRSSEYIINKPLTAWWYALLAIGASSFLARSITATVSQEIPLNVGHYALWTAILGTIVMSCLSFITAAYPQRIRFRKGWISTIILSWFGLLAYFSIVITVIAGTIQMQGSWIDVMALFTLVLVLISYVVSFLGLSSVRTQYTETTNATS